ncbi:hypothetical protein Vretimale_1224 [Volvox reticuliferus]|uniref:Uncharacterized protein n=1 Tax=Volvox reticuliferus TaxID=1737510 RepID=A0A8J4G395_9CHLO|nr:hypothetical protein Vretifemale_10627 [Volvox reticuliferus]GIL95184.1 hypothetical protein Vretimale_1224 [Volvox reticuliferus]
MLQKKTLSRAITHKASGIMSIPTRRNAMFVRYVPAVCALGSDNKAQFGNEQPFSAATSSVFSPLISSQNDAVVSAPLVNPNSDRDLRTEATAGGGDGASIGGGNGGGGGDNGGRGRGDGEGDDRVLTLSEVEAFAAEKKMRLPADMLEVAKKYGLRLSVLNAFVAAQGLLLSGLLCRTMPYFRDRILADPLFLFKVGAEVLIDSGCATVAEVRKRGKKFWSEFEFYLSDLLVGLVLDVVLVSLMAPAAVLGGVSRAAMTNSPLKKWLATIPSAVFEASVPGVKTYSLAQRVACLGVKFLEYSLAGICCGLIGQGLANSLMTLRRQMHGTKEEDVPVPPLFKTALVWGLFMGVSSNTRYQIVFGLERLVDMTIARSVPQVAYGTTVAIRFVNNVVGGENFIDMARWAGVQ